MNRKNDVTSKSFRTQSGILLQGASYLPGKIFQENDRLSENKNILKDNGDYLWKQNKQPHKRKYRPLRSFEKV